MSKEIPILYSTAMAKAKVEMRKTQTRLVVKFPADFDGKEVYLNGQFGLKYTSNDFEGCVKRLYPKWQPNDLLWGRESVNKGKNGKFHYKADELGPLDDVKWTPSIHMPKAAARIWDEVISVRVERVSDISVEDCIAEGIEYWNIDKDAFEGGELVADYKNYTWVDDEKHPEYWSPTFANAKYSYRSLWQLINGKPKPTKTGYIVYPFDAEAGKQFEGMTSWKGKPLTVVINPWVWVIETKQLSVAGKPLFKKLSAIDGTAM